MSVVHDNALSSSRWQSLVIKMVCVISYGTSPLILCFMFFLRQCSSFLVSLFPVQWSHFDHDCTMTSSTHHHSLNYVASSPAPCKCLPYFLQSRSSLGLTIFLVSNHHHSHSSHVLSFPHESQCLASSPIRFYHFPGYASSMLVSRAPLPWPVCLSTTLSVSIVIPFLSLFFSFFLTCWENNDVND